MENYFLRDIASPTFLHSLDPMRTFEALNIRLPPARALRACESIVQAASYSGRLADMDARVKPGHHEKCIHLIYFVITGLDPVIHVAPRRRLCETRENSAQSD